MRRRGRSPAPRWGRRLLGALGLWLALAPGARAGGVLVPVEGSADEQESAQVESLSVELVVRGGHAVVTAEQLWRNGGAQPLEGELIVPLPPGVVSSSVAVFEDGRAREGRVLEGPGARAALLELLRRRREPALLEALGRDLFRARLPALAPGATRRLVVRYEQPVATGLGLGGWTLPLGAMRHRAAPGAELALRVDLTSERELALAWSPTHPVAWRRLGAGRTEGVWRGPLSPQDPDPALVWGDTAGGLGGALLTWWPQGEERGWFLFLAAAPRADPAAAPRSLTFVVDTSGSMLGEKLEQVRVALRDVIAGLGAQDRLNLIAYDTAVVPLWSAPRPVDAQARAEALGFVTRLRASGGTHAEGALVAALSPAPAEDVPSLVVFLTDGRPTLGETDTERLLAALDAVDPARRHRVHALGVGVDVNAVLLDRLALAHGGRHLVVRPGEDLAERLGALAARLERPVLTAPRFGAVGLDPSDVHPARLPDLFPGETLVVTGRYRGAGQVDLELAGRDGALERTWQSTGWAAAPGEGAAGSGVGDAPARLWALRRIAERLDAARLLGQAEPGLAAEVTALGLRFGILTEYTAFLAEPGGAGGEDPAAARRRAHAAIQSLSARRIGAGSLAQSANQERRRRALRPPGAVQHLLLATPDDRDLLEVPLGGVRHVGGRTFWYQGEGGGWVDAAVADPAAVDEAVVRFSPRFFELLEGAGPADGAALAQPGPLVLRWGGRTLRLLGP